jgi:hypothetical protein
MVRGRRAAVTAAFLGAFVRASAERHGFTSGDVFEEMIGYRVELLDDAVDEHAAFIVSRRDLLHPDRIATMRMLDYQIELARRAIVARVTGEVAP